MESGIMAQGFTKKQTQQLRKLAGVAYERNLARELKPVADAIDAMRRGEMSSFDVSRAIHEYHDGIARDLFKFYTRVDPETAVARALIDGLLERDEVGAELAGLESWIETLRRLDVGTGVIEDDVEPQGPA